jgi:hypothetical protein
MIYTEIDNLSRDVVTPLAGEVQQVINEIERLTVAANKEDSKSKEKQMREEITALKKRQRNLSGAISVAREEAFKKALAEEYGVVGNPKFEQCYSIAYSHGHGCGYSEVEIYFSDLVELIR